MFGHLLRHNSFRKIYLKDEQMDKKVEADRGMHIEEMIRQADYCSRYVGMKKLAFNRK